MELNHAFQSNCLRITRLSHFQSKTMKYQRNRIPSLPSTILQQHIHDITESIDKFIPCSHSFLITSSNPIVFNLPFGLPIIPTGFAMIGLIFMIFSFDNKVDLTDAGRLQERKRRRAERELKGESTMDKGKLRVLLLYNYFHYNYTTYYIVLSSIGIQTDDDEEIEEVKKGGGCG